MPQEHVANNFFCIAFRTAFCNSISHVLEHLQRDFIKRAGTLAHAAKSCEIQGIACLFSLSMTLLSRRWVMRAGNLNLRPRRLVNSTIQDSEISRAWSRCHSQIRVTLPQYRLSQPRLQSPIRHYRCLAAPPRHARCGGKPALGWRSCEFANELPNVVNQN